MQLRDEAGATSLPRSFSILVLSVNDPPNFTIGPNIRAVYDAGFQTIPLWVRNITPGPGETNQTLTFTITPTDSTLFGLQPVINAAGHLTFATEGASIGTDVFNLVLRDNGGTANGGRDTSDSQAFVVTLTTNRAPILSITPLGTNVLLSWPLGLPTNLVLQTWMGVAQPWSNAPSGPANFIAIPTSDRRKFFRLRPTP